MANIAGYQPRFEIRLETHDLLIILVPMHSLMCVCVCFVSRCDSCDVDINQTYVCACESVRACVSE